MMSIACKDMGVEGCDFVAKAETAEEAQRMLKAHGASAHGMTEEMMMTPENMAKMESAMKSE